MSVVKKQTVTRAWLNSAGNANTLSAGDFYVVEHDGTYQATSGSTFVKVEQADMPTFGTAAAKNVEDFATSAQGELAESALQSGSLKTVNGQSIVGPGDIVINTNAPLWVGGTAYPNGTCVVSPLSSHVYMKRTASGVSAVDPANDKTNWRLIGAGGIKSIQRGVIVLASTANTASATISTVNRANSILEWLGSSATNVNLASAPLVRISLDSDIAVTANRIIWPSAVSGEITVSWQLTEYWS